MKKVLIALACLSFVLSSPGTLAASPLQKQNTPAANPAKVGVKGKADLKKSRHHHSSSRSSADETWISATVIGDQPVTLNDHLLFNTIVDQDGEVSYTSGVFYTKDRGDYEITFGGRWVGQGPPSFISLRINGTVLPASIIANTGGSGDWVSISLIVDLPRDSTIEVIDDPLSETDIVFIDPTGGSTSSAFITIEKLDLKKSRHDHSSSSSSSSSWSKEHDDTWISAVALGTGDIGSNQVVASGSPIIFNTVVDYDGELSYDGLGTFNTINAGNYEITFGGRWIADGNSIISLKVNGTVLPVSRVDNPGPDGGDWVVISLIVDLPRNSTIQVINDPLTGAPIELDDPTDGSTSSAFITIVRLD